MTKQFDVIIIGGGATGAGVARDCSLRGIRALLLERGDIATGATGRNHGLLHSGARYAVTDRESAEECIKENMILRRIASHCVEQTDGLFLSLPEDGLEFQAKFVEACRAAGIRADVIDPKEALRLEPSANPAMIGAVRVPDGAVDPFRLTAANVIDAKAHGAEVLTYHEVLDFLREQNRITGVKVLDRKTGQTAEYRAQVVVNAGGIWGHDIARKAGVTVNMLPAKGSLLIFGHRVNNIVLNRCRKPADADILVPGDTISLIGTTSSKVPFDEVDDMYVTADEVDLLLREGMKLAPSLEHTRILRAYAGVRPLVASDDDPSGRSVSRGIVVLDHATRDGLEGFVTITGGKWKAAGQGGELTDEERQYFQERINTLHQIFKADVGRHMGLTADPQLWGEAQLLLAQPARELGLVTDIVRDRDAAIRKLAVEAQMTREELAAQSPELVDALLAEGRLKAEAENKANMDKAAADAVAGALAVVKAVAGDETASRVETTLNTFRATGMSAEQIATVAPLLVKAEAPAPEDAEAKSRADILAGLQNVHQNPVAAAPGTVPSSTGKSPLLADAERRAEAAK